MKISLAGDKTIPIDLVLSICRFNNLNSSYYKQFGEVQIYDSSDVVGLKKYRDVLHDETARALVKALLSSGPGVSIEGACYNKYEFNTFNAIRFPTISHDRVRRAQDDLIKTGLVDVVRRDIIDRWAFTSEIVRVKADLGDGGSSNPNIIYYPTNESLRGALRITLWPFEGEEVPYRLP